MDRVTLDRSGADDGDLDHQIVEALRLRSRQGLHLGPALDLEDADGISLLAELVDLRVFEVERVEVGTLAGVGLDQIERLGNDREHAQPEHVHLDQAQFLDVVLVELHHHPAGHGGALDGHDVDQRLARDQHAADVDREVTREFEDLGGEVEQLLPGLRDVGRRVAGRLGDRLGTLRVPGRGRFRQVIDRLLLEAQRLAHLANRRSLAVGDDVADHPGALRPVFFVDVLDDLLAMRRREVDVDVRRGRHLLVQEPLEQQVVLDRVHPGDAQ